MALKIIFTLSYYNCIIVDLIIKKKVKIVIKYFKEQDTQGNCY